MTDTLLSCATDLSEEETQKLKDWTNEALKTEQGSVV